MATQDKDFKVKNGLIVGNSTNLVNYTSASPSNPFIGQLWISASSLYAWSSASTWVLIGDGNTGGTPITSVSTVKHEVKAAEPILKGQAVYISSATGTNMLVSKSSNTLESMSSKTLGLIDATLATNDIGNVVTEGLLAGLNTDGATVGDPVWLGTSGSLIYGLVNKPVAPAHLVYLGVVTRVNTNNGEIFVHVQNGFELQELHNVLIQTVSNNQILSYNSASSLWMNKDLQAAIKEVDGAGSGIDADLLDGNDSSYYLSAETASLIYLPSASYTASDILNKIKTVDGIGSSLDADLLDGLDGSYFVNTSSATQEKVGNFTFHGTLTVDQLVVSGSSTFIATQDLSVTDSLILLASEQYNSDGLDVGFIGSYGDGTTSSASHYHASFARDASQNKWKLLSNGPAPVNNVIDYSDPLVEFGILQLKAIEVSSSAVSTNLNADMLDGYHANYFLPVSASANYLPISASANYATQEDYNNIRIAMIMGIY